LQKYLSPHPSLLPKGEKGFFLLSSREERIEVRRDLNPFRCYAKDSLKRGRLIGQIGFFEMP